MPRTLAYLLLLLFPWSAAGQNSQPATGAEERPKGRARIGVALEVAGRWVSRTSACSNGSRSITSPWITLREQAWAGWWEAFMLRE